MLAWSGVFTFEAAVNGAGFEGTLAATAGLATGRATADLADAVSGLPAAAVVGFGAGAATGGLATELTAADPFTAADFARGAGAAGLGVSAIGVIMRTPGWPGASKTAPVGGDAAGAAGVALSGVVGGRTIGIVTLSCAIAIAGTNATPSKRTAGKSR
jgi:hypothetical protein